MIGVILDLIGGALPALLGIGTLVVGWFVNNKVQQKKGRKQQQQKAKEADHENANEIRDRVGRNRDKLVRILDDAGFRD